MKTPGRSDRNRSRSRVKEEHNEKKFLRNVFGLELSRSMAFGWFDSLGKQDIPLVEKAPTSESSFFILHSAFSIQQPKLLSSTFSSDDLHDSSLGQSLELLA